MNNLSTTMNVKLTDIDFLKHTKNDSTHNIPCIIHFLPGCNDYEESWRELNPECIILSWDVSSLQRIISNHHIAKNIQIDASKDDFVISSLLCYCYGGIVISKPEKCFVGVRHLLNNLPNTLLAVFSLSGSSLLDNSIVISSAKLGALNSLMEYFMHAKQQNKSPSIIFRDFVKSSMDASNDGAIVCLHSNVKDKITKEPKIEYIESLSTLENHIPSSNFFKIIEASEFSSRVTPWLTKLGKQESTTEKVGILVIDSDKFDKEAPVPQAIAAVLAFQDCVLCDDALVIVAHSPTGGISLDMMLIPQLTMMNAKEIYRSDHVVWKLGSRN
jgi:hypothetical protein